MPVADLDPAARAEWTAEQWQRAEAAGLLRLALPQTEPPEAAPEPSPEPQLSQHSPIEAPLRDDLLVWWDEGEERWYTCFPPPDDFDGDEDGSPEDMDYSRTLTDEEEEAMGRGPEHHAPATIAALARSRAPYFARIAQQRSVPQLPPLLARLLAARDGGAGASNGGSAGGSRPPPSHCPPQTASPGGE
ncbi:hypothetical protein SPHI_29120 [Sphingomonas jeddahensis]|uniref:Uncharacterized protein n=1 Tax=Sphingomonas jeddahensis TaxID=1915074 RepID=A0A1V2EQH4_9SPHN|nr:hypothetical protein SPHI_29120 [Sphingomonas jeddahensis]